MNRLIDADKLKIKCHTVNDLQPDKFVVTRMMVSSEVIDTEPTVEAIPIEWIKNKRDELEKEYYDLFHAYTDEVRTKQPLVLDDLYAFRTVLRYWEKENG